MEHFPEQSPNSFELQIGKHRLISEKNQADLPQLLRFLHEAQIQLPHSFPEEDRAQA